MLPNHGPINCRRCWEDLIGRKEFIFDHHRFKLVNDPGAWGSSNPKILVLGITKGNTQSVAMGTDEFDSVAFKAFRPNLLKVLQSVGLAQDVTNLDPLLTAAERDYAWGSVIRCSLTGWDARHQQFVGETSKVLPAFNPRHSISKVCRTCISTFLAALPERLLLVVLLGNSNSYLKIIKSYLNELYDDFSSPVEFHGNAHRAGGIWWVHVAHPSRANGYLKEFLEAPPDFRQGRKRAVARLAISRALAAK